MNIKQIVVIFIVGYVVPTYSVITEKNKVYLENHYGAPIICKVLNNNTKEDDRLRSNKDVVVNNQNRVLLGLIPHAKNSASRLQWVNDINIKTTSYLSAGYTTLNNYLEAMSNAINTCCNGMSIPQNARQYCKDNNVCGKDAIIVVYPSSIASGWKIDVQWRDSSRTVVGQ